MGGAVSECVICGARGVEVTCSGDSVRSYICTGVTSHSYTDIDLPPEPEQAPEPGKRSLLARLFGR